MIYFDNAATSFPKPKTVIKSAANAMKSLGNPGRGGYKLSLDAAAAVFKTRMAAAEFFGSGSPEKVIFTANATMSLNMAVRCLAKPGWHILTSCFEHNSVLRPLHFLQSSGAASYDIFDADLTDDEKTVENVLAALKPETKMIVMTHVSNVCGKILPLKGIISAVKAVREDIIFIVDAAQSAGVLPVNMKDMDIDVLCAPSHKGLLGIAGAGLLIFCDRINPEECAPFLMGGTGINSLEYDMPAEFPERLEAGTQSVAAIVSLAAGMEYINSVGIEEIRRHETELYNKASEMLRNNPNIDVYSKSSDHNYTGAILFNLKSKDNEEVSHILAGHEIAVRGGFHCSPLAHSKLGTSERGGVRISFGYNNSMNELERFYSVLKQLL